MTAKPLNPRLVLLSAIVLPGSGQVINREPWRGLTFVFFILLLGGFTLKTAAPDVSVVGQLSGGLFVWAMAAFDAYRRARMRAEIWRYRASAESASPRA